MADGVGHVVGNHHGGQVVFLNQPVGDFQHLGGGGGVQGGGVLVQQKQLGLLQRSHQKGQRLPLAAGEQPGFGGKPVFQAQAQNAQPFLIHFPLAAANAPAQAAVFAPAQGQRQIFFDLHIGRGAHHGILKHPADDGGALVLGLGGHVLTIDDDFALVHAPHAGHGVEHGGFPRAVAADDGHEVPFVQAQVQIRQRHLFVDGAGIEGLVDMADIKHCDRLPGKKCAADVYEYGCALPGTAGKARSGRWPRSAP